MSLNFKENAKIMLFLRINYKSFETIRKKKFVLSNIAKLKTKAKIVKFLFQVYINCYSGASDDFILSTLRSSGRICYFDTLNKHDIYVTQGEQRESFPSCWILEFLISQNVA